MTHSPIKLENHYWAVMTKTTTKQKYNIERGQRVDLGITWTPFFKSVNSRNGQKMKVSSSLDYILTTFQDKNLLGK